MALIVLIVLNNHVDIVAQCALVLTFRELVPTLRSAGFLQKRREQALNWVHNEVDYWQLHRETVCESAQLPCLKSSYSDR